MGELVAYDADTGMAEVDVKNRFQVGDQLELIMPGGNHSFRLDLMQDMAGKSTDVAPGSGYHVRIPLPTEADARCLL